MLHFKRQRGMRVGASALALMATTAILAGCGTTATPGNGGTTPKSHGRIQITFWTAYSGQLGSDIQHIVNQFNASQTKYEVKAVYKGTYPEVLSATIAAYRAHQAPNITMVFDVGTATMMDSSGVYVPVYKLMAQNHIPFATSNFIGAAGSYYETASGKLDSMPFASSTPVLYYNKAMLASIRAKVPTTWTQMGTVGQGLVSHGTAKNGFTIGWPDWTQFEQFAVWNNYHYATHHNGYTAIKGVKLLINTPPFVNHIAQLASWQKSGVFTYDGRESTPATLFIDGKVGMYIDSSGEYSAIASGAKFAFGEAPLPYVAGAAGAPHNTVVGGNSLWVMSGNPAATYPADAAFLHFLMSGPVQAYWATHTGYVAVTNAGVAQLTNNGYYQAHPDAKVAINELTNKPANSWTRGIRLGNLPQIRNIENAAITAVFAGRESAQTALNAAETQGNAVLANFASQY